MQQVKASWSSGGRKMGQLVAELYFQYGLSHSLYSSVRPSHLHHLLLLLSPISSFSSLSSPPSLLLLLLLSPSSLRVLLLSSTPPRPPPQDGHMQVPACVVRPLLVKRGGEREDDEATACILDAPMLTIHECSTSSCGRISAHVDD